MRSEPALAAGWLLVTIVAVTLEMYAFAETGRRWLEFVIGVSIAIPNTLAYSRRMMVTPGVGRAEETSKYRSLAVVQFLCALVFLGDLFIWLALPHRTYPDLAWIDACNIATFIYLTPSFMINSYYAWQRARRSSDKPVALREAL